MLSDLVTKKITKLCVILYISIMHIDEPKSFKCRYFLMHPIKEMHILLIVLIIAWKQTSFYQKSLSHFLKKIFTVHSWRNSIADTICTVIKERERGKGKKEFKELRIVKMRIKYISKTWRVLSFLLFMIKIHQLWWMSLIIVNRLLTWAIFSLWYVSQVCSIFTLSILFKLSVSFAEFL